MQELVKFGGDMCMVPPLQLKHVGVFLYAGIGEIWW